VSEQQAQPQPNNDDLRRLICDVVERALAPLRTEIGELRSQIAQTAQRQDAMRVQADDNIGLIRSEVHDNAAAILATREHISTLQTETSAINRGIQATLHTNSLLLQKLDDRMTNVSERQDNQAERTTWLSGEMDETRQIAVRADDESQRVAQDLSDTHMRNQQLQTLVQQNATTVNRIQVDLDDMLVQYRPLIEFAALQKQQAEARAEMRARMAAAAASRPGLTIVVMMGGLLTGTGAYEILTLIAELLGG